MRGTLCAEQAGIAVPVGWRFTPDVDFPVVAERLRLRPGDLALFHTDGTWERIAAEHFVKASRSAARLTAREAVS
jgi:hypothetical protein